jgi:hypothetical protein
MRRRQHFRKLQASPRASVEKRWHILTQLVAQFPEILDNSVVNDADTRAHMRMRVTFIWFSMRCSARVADPDQPVKWFGRETELQILKLPAYPSASHSAHF